MSTHSYPPRYRHAVFVSLLLCMSLAPGIHAGDIPSHPKSIDFPALDWQVPLGSPYRQELDDGLVAYLAPDHALPKVTIQGLVRYGAMLDPEGMEGLSALFATLMRTGGTKHTSADTMDMLLDLYAASVSFSVSPTQLKFSATCLSEHLDTVLVLLGELLSEPAFEKERVEKERAVMLERIAHRFDNPGPVTKAAHSLVMYPGQPNSRLSTSASVTAIRRRDLVSLHKRLFTRGNIIAGAAGDFDPDAMADALLELIPRARTDQPTFPDIAVRHTPLSLVVHKEMTQAYVRMSLPMFRRPHPDYYACSILNFVLGGGSFSSRLNTTVRSDAGLTYSIYSAVGSNYVYPGTFYVQFHTKTETVDDAIALTVQEMKRIVETGITEEELASARQVMIDGLPSMFRSADDIVEHYVWNEYSGRSPTHFRDYPPALRKLTVEDVNRAARTYLHVDSLSYIVVGDTTALWDSAATAEFDLRTLSPHTILPDSLPAFR